MTRDLPRPSSARALSTLTCASSPITTSSSGAEKSPRASTSQPSRARSAWRAAASAVKFASVAPVTKPPAVPAGSASASTIQRSATASTRAVPGVTSERAEFWSHAVASTFAATAAGSAPPMTNPKKRGPAVAMVAGPTISSRSARIAVASAGSAGRGTSSAARPSIAAADGATGRSPIVSR